MTDKCKMSERLDHLEDLVKYLTQAADRIGGMVQVLTRHIDEIEERTKPGAIRKVAQD